MAKKSRRRFNPDAVSVPAPSVSSAEMKRALKAADEVTAADVAALGYYAPFGSLHFSEATMQDLYEALRDADVKFQKKIAKVVEFLNPVFKVIEKATFGKISSNDLEKILMLKLPTVGAALFLEVALGGRPIDEGLTAIARILKRDLTTGASTFAIIVGLTAAVDSALLIPGAQFLAPVAVTLTPLAAIALPAGLACGAVAALLSCIIDRKMPSKEELSAVMQATAKLAKRPVPSQAQIDLAYKAYGANTGASPAEGERKNPRGKKRKKNPTTRRQVPIEGASTRAKKIVPDPTRSWHAIEVHPIHQTGQMRLFKPEDFPPYTSTRSPHPDFPGIVIERTVPVVPELSQYYQRFDESVDPFVYSEEFERPEQEPYKAGNWRLKKRVSPVAVFDGLQTEIRQEPLFWQGDLDELEQRLNETAVRLKEELESKEKSSNFEERYFESDFENYLTEGDHLDSSWNPEIDNLIEQIKAVGGEDEDEVPFVNKALEVFSDSSNWRGVLEGNESSAEYNNEYPEIPISLTPRDQRGDSDISDCLDDAKGVFEVIASDDVGVEDLMECWLDEVLRYAGWSLNNDEWTTYVTQYAHAFLRSDRVESQLQDVLDEARAAQEGEGEGEGEGEVEVEQVPYSQRTMPRRPYTPPVTSDLLEHITLPHDYMLYNVSWAEFEAIGKAMKICVGGHGYAERVQKGEIQIWLVRDPSGENLFCLEVHFADPEHLNPEHFVQVKGTRNRFPGWSDKDFYPYADQPFVPLRTRAENPANVDVMLTKRELVDAQPVPGGEVALCRALCEQVGLDPYLQPDLLCGLYAKERFEVFDVREPQYRQALARAQRNEPRANPYATRGGKRVRQNELTLRWPHGTSFAVEYWRDEYGAEDEQDDEQDERTNPHTRPLHAPAKPPKLAEGAVYKALWIGGPPGQTMIKLKKKLENQGIDVVRQVMDVKIPAMKSYDIVLFNIEHASHGHFYQAKEMAKEAGVPFILAGHSWAKTHQNLKEAGFIRRNPRR